MKVFAFVFTTLLASASMLAASAYAQCTSHVCQDYLSTGTVFEIAQQYSNGGKFGGISPTATGSVLEIARSSIDLTGAPEFFVSGWRVPPAVAKGE